MAWQQQSSGSRYHSLSGHGLLMGRYTWKPALVIKSKVCNYCTNFERTNTGFPVPNHHCSKNHNGSSGSMESAACLEIVIDLYWRHSCTINKLCCDDDSSVWADVRWANEDYMKNNNTTILPKVTITKGPNKGKLKDWDSNKGKLLADIKEPLFGCRSKPPT